MSDISFQSVKTWKESKDPEFEKKKARIVLLTRKKTNPPVVLSLDEMGQFNLIPHRGRGWFEQSNPERISANYNKFGGAWDLGFYIHYWRFGFYSW